MRRPDFSCFSASCSCSSPASSSRLSGSDRARRETKRRREEARAVAGAAAIALLPSLLASRVGGLALVLPAAAALAYGVWRENAPRRDSRD
jgi:hypothetical protein